MGVVTAGHAWGGGGFQQGVVWQEKGAGRAVARVLPLRPSQGPVELRCLSKLRQRGNSSLDSVHLLKESKLGDHNKRFNILLTCLY